jgi:hypothetical protein
MLKHSVVLAADLLLTGASAWAQAPLHPGSKIVNKADTPIQEIRAAPAGVTDWSHNKLEGGPLAPGQTRDIRLMTETNCLYDVRAVFADGTTEDRHNVDICKHQDTVFTGAGSDRTTTK